MATAVELYDAIRTAIDPGAPDDGTWENRSFDALTAVVEHHRPDLTYGLKNAWCGGCDNGEYAQTSPGTPCSTLLLIAERLGVTVAGD